MTIKIRGLTCTVCKKNIIVGQQAVEVVIEHDDGTKETRKLVHSANGRPTCLQKLRKELENE